jgi:hypothetical protein
MSLNEIDRKELRRQVEKEVQQQKQLARTIFFVVNLLIYILFMMIGWGMFLANHVPPPPPVIGRASDPIAGAMVMLSVAGGLGVMFQFLSLMLETRMSDKQMRAKITARVVGEKLLGIDDEDAAADEKEKRTMRLTDDGELEEIGDEVIVDEAPQQKQQR